MLTLRNGLSQTSDTPRRNEQSNEQMACIMGAKNVLTPIENGHSRAGCCIALNCSFDVKRKQAHSKSHNRGFHMSLFSSESKLRIKRFSGRGGSSIFDRGQHCLGTRCAQLSFTVIRDRHSLRDRFGWLCIIVVRPLQTKYLIMT
jgi:hypothetical protein